MPEDPYPPLRMRPFWRWHAGIFAGTCLLTLALDAWRGWDWLWVAPFAVGALLMLHMHKFVRCPRCSRRLTARVVRERYMPDSWRYLYDCPECKVTWDSRYILDGSSG
jgi:hypothetical protein